MRVHWRADELVTPGICLSSVLIMLGAIISLPWRLVRAPISTLMIPKAPGRHLWHLPVSGLDEGRAQDIVFSLRRAARTEEVGTWFVWERSRDWRL